MNGPVTETQWYIARDGKQHGPLTDIEMRTFVAHSYLRVTDLIWRPGMAEWLPAPQVFPAIFQAAPAAPAAPAQSPATVPASAPQQPHTSDFDTAEAEEVKPPRSALRKLVTAAAVVSVVGGGAYALTTYREPLMQMVNGTPVKPPVVKSPTVATKVAPTPPPAAPDVPAKPADVAAPATPPAVETKTAALPPPEPPAITAPTAPPSIVGSQIDARLQKIPVWSAIKKDYPDWYIGHISAAEKLSIDKRPEGDIALHLAQGLVTLRRQHADKALSASPDKLRRVATAFLENLKFLQSQSVSACYGFISKGETTPAVVQLLQTPESATTFNAHVSAIFEAIDEGGKKPAKHDAAVKADYDILIKELGKIGWKEEDLQVFSNPRLLSKRAPEQVCQMVLDWFMAHLAVKDKGAQDRLLFETLKPVVTG